MSLQVVTETTTWSGELAAVNAIGMTGMYGHLLLKSCDYHTQKDKHNDTIPRLVVVSGRTHDGMEDLLYKVCNYDTSLLFSRQEL